MNTVWCFSIFLIAIVWYQTSVVAYTGAKMGVSKDTCDDAKTNLTVDWDYNFNAYTCMGLRKWSSSSSIQPLYYGIPNFKPKTDQVFHYCMNMSILYKDRPPIRGHHRPLWAKWGEYLYLPPQRWLHNLEHGSIVMLYHPCVDEHELNKLRGLVTSCLYRHIITPYDKLTADRPLALISWGAKLEMNVVNAEQAIMFMKRHAHNAPEDLSKQGQFDEMLINPSAIVNDIEDSIVCPWAPDTFYTPDAQAAQQYENQQKFGSFQDVTNFLPLKRRGSVVNVKKQQQDRGYMEPFLLLADRFNGPRQAYDVLPPFARLPYTEQPHYVAAGTFLGNNPMHPLSLYRADLQQRLPPWIINGLLTSRQDLPLPGAAPGQQPNLALDLRTLARLIALVSLLRQTGSSISTKTVLPGLLPHGIKIDSQVPSSSNSADSASTVTLLQGLLSLLMGNFSSDSSLSSTKASGRPLAYPLSILLQDNGYFNKPKH